MTGTDLHIFVFSESIPQPDIDGFTAASGAKVSVSTYETNEELIAALKARPGAYDLVMPSDYAVDELINADELLPLDLAKIPNYNDISPSFLTPWFDPGGIAQASRGHTRNEKFSLPWLWGTTGIVYDPSFVSPAPTRWADLWNPANTGHLVLPDDAREMLGIGLLALGYSKNDADPAHLEAAKQKLMPLVAGAVALDANTPETSLLATPIHGPAARIGVVFSGNAALARRTNPDLQFVLPSEGAGIWFDNLAIPKDAPHPEAAMALIDWLLSPDSGAGAIEWLPYSTPNEAAMTALKAHDLPRWKAYSEDPISNPPMDAIAAAVPVKNVGPEGQARFEKAWAEIVAARGGAR